MLDTIAHNHSGRVHPTAVPTSPHLSQILTESTGWPRWAALEIIVDLLEELG